MIKVVGDMVVDWIWRLCSMACESGVMPAMTVLLYKGKGTED